MTTPADFETTQTSIADSEPSPTYARYALGLLVVVYVFNFIDRSILNILLEPIKEEFQVSDSALGFLSGFAFAALYTVMGIPIARWSDRGRRSSIIALAVLVWSGMTAATGLAQSFTHLVLARIGVGIGEAGCSPPAHSLISDYFPPSKRATALSIYALGIPVGAGLGYLAGGWIGQFFGWRMAFIVVGLPGVILALLVRFTLKEPKRGQFDGEAAQTAAQKTVREVFQFMNGLKSFRHMALAASLHAFYGYGSGAFLASFFIRSHQLEKGEIATWFAFIACTAGVAGTFLGGYLSDRLGTRDRRWYMWVPAIGTALSIPFWLVLYLATDPTTALIFNFFGSIFSGMYLGPTFAMTQTLVPPNMRATAAAILLFSINMIGLGLGPQCVGILSDLLASTFGQESLRYSLLFLVVGFAAWSITHYLLAARSLRKDLEDGNLTA